MGGGGGERGGRGGAGRGGGGPGGGGGGKFGGKNGVGGVLLGGGGGGEGGGGGGGGGGGSGRGRGARPWRRYGGLGGVLHGWRGFWIGACGKLCAVRSRCGGSPDERGCDEWRRLLLGLEHSRLVGCGAWARFCLEVFLFCRAEWQGRHVEEDYACLLDANSPKHIHASLTYVRDLP